MCAVDILYVHMYVWVCVPTQRPQEDAPCLPLLLDTIFVETKSLKLKSAVRTRLAGQ